MTVTEELLLQAMQLLAKAKIHASRDMSIGGQRCSTEICEFLARNRGAFYELQTLETQQQRLCSQEED
jgi:hypothetical protein